MKWAAPSEPGFSRSGSLDDDHDEPPHCAGYPPWPSGPAATLLDVSDQRRELLARFERATELPLLILAIAMIPLLLAPLLVDMSDQWESAIVAADWFIWSVFALEYIVRLTLSERRWQFIRREWSRC